jgi:hypothetical protein
MHSHRNYARQPVSWGTFVEAPPPVVAPYVETRPADWLLLAVLRPAWAYRLELALLTLVAVAYVWLGDHLGRANADRLIVAAAFMVALRDGPGSRWPAPWPAPTSGVGGRWPAATPTSPPAMTGCRG